MLSNSLGVEVGTVSRSVLFSVRKKIITDRLETWCQYSPSDSFILKPRTLKVCQKQMSLVMYLNLGLNRQEAWQASN